MAYFSVAANPKKTIKSKSNGSESFIDLSDFKPANNKLIGDDWDVQIGDVISWGDYRACDTYFVDEKRRLKENEDTSGSGYLTIPISITQLFPSALKHYASLLEEQHSLVSCIELAPTDGIFAEKFGSPLPETICHRTDISYSFDPMDVMLYITVGKNEPHGFRIEGTKTKDIVDYVNIVNEKKAALIVKYDIQSDEASAQWPGYMNSNLLPTGWSCQSFGGTTAGSNYMKGAWKIQGPERFKQQALDTVEKYYSGFNVNVAWQEH